MATETDPHTEVGIPRVDMSGFPVGCRLLHEDFMMKSQEGEGLHAAKVRTGRIRPRWLRPATNGETVPFPRNIVGCS